MKIGSRVNPSFLFVGTFIPDIIMKSEELTSTDKLVWGRLSRYAGEDGKCYPKQQTLSVEIGTSLSAVIRSIKHLCELGYVECEKASGKDRLVHANNTYYFLWHKSFESSELRKCHFDTSRSVLLTPPNKEGHNKDFKKEKYKKEKTPENFVHLLPAKFRNDKLFQQSWEEFVQHRKTMKPRPKPLSELAAKKCINKLIKLSNSDVERAIALIDQTIEKNNDTFWPLYKSNELNKTKQPTPPPKKKQDAHQKNIDNQPVSIWTFTTEEDLDALQEADNRHFRKHKRRMTKTQQEKWLQGHLGF